MTKRQPRISYLTEGEMIDAEELWIERLRQEISRDDIAKAVGRCKDTIKDWEYGRFVPCLLYTSPSPRDRTRSRMPSSA